eukprot:g48669.t1
MLFPRSFGALPKFEQNLASGGSGLRVSLPQRGKTSDEMGNQSSSRGADPEERWREFLVGERLKADINAYLGFPRREVEPNTVDITKVGSAKEQQRIQDVSEHFQRGVHVGIKEATEYWQRLLKQQEEELAECLASKRGLSDVSESSQHAESARLQEHSGDAHGELTKKSRKLAEEFLNLEKSFRLVGIENPCKGEEAAWLSCDESSQNCEEFAKAYQQSVSIHFKLPCDSTNHINHGSNTRQDLQTEAGMVHHQLTPESVTTSSKQGVGDPKLRRTSARKQRSASEPQCLRQLVVYAGHPRRKI